jgi:hypothetical protein
MQELAEMQEATQFLREVVEAAQEGLVIGHRYDTTYAK